MLDVFFTVDVEVWCGGWVDIDARFPDAFQRYVYGRTPRGDFGLPYTLKLLADHGLVGVFFVESLFATRFGLESLQEIVGLVQQSGHEVQLHLHPEWVDESRPPLLPNAGRKRPMLRDFSRDEQQLLIAAAKDLILKAGGRACTAFRAGNYGFNHDTLHALAANAIVFDSSYTVGASGPDVGLAPGTVVVEPVRSADVFEYPVTMFDDGSSRLRPMQLTACSYRETEGLLWQALETGRKAFVIVSHNFELLAHSMNRPDDVVVDRFHRLCSLLDRHRDCFRVRGFAGLQGTSVTRQPPPLTSAPWKTGLRMAEQLARRRYR